MLENIEETLAESAAEIAEARARIAAVRDSFDGLDHDEIKAAVTRLERIEADLARMERTMDAVGA